MPCVWCSHQVSFLQKTSPHSPSQFHPLSKSSQANSTQPPHPTPEHLGACAVPQGPGRQWKFQFCDLLRLIFPPPLCLWVRKRKRYRFAFLFEKVGVLLRRLVLFRSPPCCFSSNLPLNLTWRENRRTCHLHLRWQIWIFLGIYEY